MNFEAFFPLIFFLKLIYRNQQFAKIRNNHFSFQKCKKKYFVEIFHRILSDHRSLDFRLIDLMFETSK